MFDGDRNRLLWFNHGVSYDEATGAEEKGFLAPNGVEYQGDKAMRKL